MMPNQPRENGITQNNGVIEDHWGESPVCGHGLMSTGLDTPQQRLFPPQAGM